jgi:hypothetical protein
LRFPGTLGVWYVGTRWTSPGYPFVLRLRSCFVAGLLLAAPLLLTSGPAASAQQAIQAAPADGIHQRSVLYEEDASNPAGRQSTGTVVWRAETIKIEGKPDDVAIRADVDIPSRRLQLTLMLKRNLDPGLPASHVIELTSRVPPDFDNGGIENIPGIMMKSDEPAKGTPLAGLSIKVTDGFFMIGLSNSIAADRSRNLDLLAGRAWLDIPISYTNRHRGILAIAKGETGEEVFRTVLGTWGQYQPAPSAPLHER